MLLYLNKGHCGSFMNKDNRKLVKKGRNPEKGQAKNYLIVGKVTSAFRNEVNIQRYELDKELKQIKLHRKDLLSLQKRNKGRLDWLIVPKLNVIWKLENSLSILSETLRNLWFKRWNSRRRSNLCLNVSILEIDISLVRDEYRRWETFCRDSCRLVCHRSGEYTCTICLNHRSIKSDVSVPNNETNKDKVVERE